MRSSLFYNVTQLWQLVAEGSKQPVGRISKTEPMGCLQTTVTTDQRYVISQHSQDLIYTAAEALSDALSW